MITILLATYNSERFIKEQLDSILKQTYEDWKLVIRDDMSKDKTIDVITDYINLFPTKISLLDNRNESKGAYLNFIELLKSVESEYYMFCDHDDVWLPNKIELSIQRMQSIDNSHLPVVVHTDMIVVDHELQQIHKSFWQYSRLLPDHVSFKELAVCNSVNGCTMLFNRKARDFALNHIAHATMHDMLVAQTTAAMNGIISAIKQPTVLYRQHPNNVVGAHKRNLKFYKSRFLKISQTTKNNIVDWRLSSQIYHYTFLSYIFKKIEIIFLRFLKNL